MFDFLQDVQPVYAYLACGGLTVLFLALWAWHVQNRRAGAGAFLLAGAVGMLLGFMALIALTKGMHFGWAATDPDDEPDAAAPMEVGGPRPPVPMGSPGEFNRGKLTTLVNKLDLATRGVRLELTPAQSATLAAALESLDDAKVMDADAADAQLAAVGKLLEADQMALVEGLILPQTGGGPPGGMAGTRGDPNPFIEGTSKETLQALIARLKESAEGAEAQPSPPAPATSTDESVDESTKTDGGADPQESATDPFAGKAAAEDASNVDSP